MLQEQDLEPKKHASTNPGKGILMDTLKAPENCDLTPKFGPEFDVSKLMSLNCRGLIEYDKD